MLFFKRFCWGLALALPLACSGNSSGQTLEYETRVLRGEPAPGFGPGVVLAGIGRPTINASGQVAFGAGLYGEGIRSGRNSGAFYSEGGGVLIPVAQMGGAVPLPERGAVFVPAAGSEPTLSNSGHVYYRSFFMTPGRAGTSGDGIFSNVGGEFHMVCREGESVFGLPAGVFLKDIEQPVRFNNHGQVAFHGMLGGEGVTEDNDWAYFAERSGVLKLVLREGQPIPGTEPGIILRNANSPSFNDLGQLAFRAFVTGENATTRIDSGIFLESDGVVHCVALRGQPAPGTEEGVAFYRFSDPAFNNAGHVAFSAELTGPWVNEANKRAIYVYQDEELRLMAREGGDAPDQPEGVVFGSLKSCSINGAGHCLLTPVLAGPGIDFSNRQTIYTDVSGAFRLIVRAGDPAPGMEEGVRLDGFRDASFNRVGQIAFTAILRGSTITSDNDLAIYLYDPEYGFFIVAREGDVIDVDDDPVSEELWKIESVKSVRFAWSNGEDGRPNSFNDQGQLAFQLDLSGGMSGVMVARFVLPEPITNTSAKPAQQPLMPTRNTTPEPTQHTGIAWRGLALWSVLGLVVLIAAVSWWLLRRR